MKSQKPSQTPWRVSWDIPKDVRAFYSDSDLGRIERIIANALGKDRLKPYEREALFHSVYSDATFLFIERSATFGRTPIREVRKRLRAIKVASETLINGINAADDLTLYFLLLNFSETNYLRPKGRGPSALDVDQVLSKEIDALRTKLQGLPDLPQAADLALQSIPPVKPGTKPDWALHRYIRAMTSTYGSWIHIKKKTIPFDAYSERYYGPLFDFIEACLSPIDPDSTKSNQALGELIRRALGLRSKPSS
ncbi:MAG: hypothetical protein V3W34_18580 [Phycisphaerae bacterium]